MRLIFLILILSIVSISCQVSKDKKNEFLRYSTFSNSETEQLVLLLEKFDEVICEIENKRNLKDCYLSFFKRAEQSKKKEPEILINSKMQDDLTSILSENLKSDLWGDMISRKENEFRNQDSIISKVLNINGKIFQFLKHDIAKDYPVIKKDVRIMETIGDISPTLYQSIFYRSELFQIEDKRFRLLVAILYIGRNEGYINKKLFEVKNN